MQRYIHIKQLRIENWLRSVKSVTDKVVVIVKDDKRFEVPRELVPAKTVKVGEQIEVAIPHDRLSSLKITTEKK
jgi:hypothetical protein